MENSLKQLVKMANGLLKTVDPGKEFTMEYVSARLERAMDEFPHDPILRSIGQVVNRQATKGKLTISQKEMYDIYNHFANLSVTSQVKDVIGDLLYKQAERVQPTGNETEYSFRGDSTMVDTRVEHNPLENLFDKSAAPASYYDPTLAKLGKHALDEELTSIGIPPTDIKVFAGDDNAIVYDAIFTNKLGTAHIPMFVEIAGGIKTPTHFYSKGDLVELTAENLNKSIVDKAQPEDVSDLSGITGGVRTASSTLSAAFAFEEDAPKAIETPRVAMPEALKDLASFENAVMDTSTPFTPELVRAAKAIVSRELSVMGYRAQVKLAEATDNCIVCSAELDSSVGKVEIKLPVEIVNDRPQIPSLFYQQDDRIYEFSKTELSNYLTAIKPENVNVLRYSNDVFNMTYAQLKDEILSGASEKNYSRAEAALNRIEDQFGADVHQAALSDYAKILSASSKEEKRHTCKLLITKGSVEPRCGHYNVAISRVTTDDAGNCVLTERQAKYDNLASSGALIRTSKINLT